MFILGGLVTFAACVFVEYKASVDGGPSKLAAIGKWFLGLF